MSLFKFLRNAAIVVLISAMSYSNLFAETRLTIQSSRPKVTIGAMVMPAAVESSTVWLGDSLARIDKGDGTVYIYDQRSKTAFKLFPKFELYQKTIFADSEGQPDSIPADEMLMAGLSQLVEDSTAHVEAMPDTSTIQGYLCHNYIVNETKVSMITVYKTSEVWATTAIDLDFELYRTITNISDLISAGSLDGVADLLKVNGVTVLRIGKITPGPDPDSLGPALTIAGDDRTELIRVEELPAPKGIFEVPTGYEESPQ
ncbi:MAG: hypothetical protein WBP29_02590 [Candidatus Zixiibacteriota bacterium]